MDIQLEKIFLKHTFKNYILDLREMLQRKYLIHNQIEVKKS